MVVVTAKKKKAQTEGGGKQKVQVAQSRNTFLFFSLDEDNNRTEGGTQSRRSSTLLHLAQTQHMNIRGKGIVQPPCQEDMDTHPGSAYPHLSFAVLLSWLDSCSDALFIIDDQPFPSMAGFKEALAGSKREAHFEQSSSVAIGWADCSHNPKKKNQESWFFTYICVTVHVQKFVIINSVKIYAA